MESAPTVGTVQWVIPALHADVAAVMVRVRTSEKPWTHIMRWHLDSGELEPGAWSTLRMNRYRCTLSSCGRFFRYAAKDFGGRPYPRPDHPFNASHAGGTTISRLPWLSALTDIKPVGAYGGGASRHALSEDDQQALHHMCPPLGAWDWWPHQQPGWQAVDSGVGARLDLSLPARSHDARMIIMCSRGAGWHNLVAAVDRSANESVSYFLARVDAGRPVEVRGLPELTWAWIDRTGRVIGATAHGELIIDRVEGTTGSMERVVLHSIRDLTPEPGPSPEWARAALSEHERVHS